MTTIRDYILFRKMHTSTRHGRRKDPRWGDHGVVQLRDEICGSPKCKVQENINGITRITFESQLFNNWWILVEYGKRRMAVLGVRKLRSVARYVNTWRLIWRGTTSSRGPRPKADSVTVRVRNTPRRSFWNIGDTKSGISTKIWKGTRYGRLIEKLLTYLNYLTLVLRRYIEKQLWISKLV